MSKNQNIIKYKKPFQLNIGLIIFLMIIIYVVFNIFSFLTSSPIAEYEVVQGTIASNHVYRGLILRDEEVVNATQDGYVNYYAKNGSKVAATDLIYSVDTIGDISSEINSARENDSLLEDDELFGISEELEGFMNSYHSNRFSLALTFKNDLNSELNQMLNTNALNQLSEEITFAEANNTFYQYTANIPGIIAYYVDGFEETSIDDIRPELFESTDYHKTLLGSEEQIESGKPAYKVIKSEDWNVIIAISDEFADSIADKKSIKVRFQKDGFTTNAACSIIKDSKQSYLNLSFHTAMIRYFNERYTDIELILNEESGLKIPKSAITTKEFYTIPKEYFTFGSDSDSLGLLVQNDSAGEESVTVVVPTIYYETENMYYVDNESVQKNDVILMPDSSQTYTVGQDIAELEGVYNINKGYAVFKQISIIYENEEYAIIEPKTSYGVALYDHIALNGSQLKEDDLVAK